MNGHRDIVHSMEKERRRLYEALQALERALTALDQAPGDNFISYDVQIARVDVLLSELHHGADVIDRWLTTIRPGESTPHGGE